MRLGYEHTTTAFLKPALKRARVFWDVGAESGHFTRLALKALPRTAAVVAFEPDTRHRLNPPVRGRTLIVRRNALGRKDGAGMLVAAGGHPRLDTAAPGLAAAATITDRSPVVVRSGDSLVAEGVPAPDVVKIDVEGAELEVLAGMPRILDTLPAVAVECHSMPLMADCIGVLKEAGYDVVCTFGGDHVGPPMLFATAG